MVPHWALSVAVVMLLSSAIGCSREKLNELVDQGKQKLAQGSESVAKTVDQAKSGMSDATSQAKETLQLAGKMEITLDAPLSTSAAYARYIPGSGTRTAILQLQSYRDAGSESFPSLFGQAAVDAEKPADLAGQTVAVQVFAQLQAEGPVSSTSAGALVQFKVVSVDEQHLVGEFVQGTLQRSDGTTPVPILGKVDAVWLKP